MKIRYLILSVIVIVALGISPIVGAQASSQKTTIEDVQKETQKLLNTIKDYSADQRDDAVRDIQGALESVDNRINALEDRVDQRWDKMTKPAREATRANLRALRKQRNQIAEWYGAMKNSSDNAWDHVTQGFSNAYQDLSKSWEKAEQEFEDGK